jgi:hypothetical protein
VCTYAGAVWACVKAGVGDFDKFPYLMMNSDCDEYDSSATFLIICAVEDTKSETDIKDLGLLHAHAPLLSETLE